MVEQSKGPSFSEPHGRSRFSLERILDLTTLFPESFLEGKLPPGTGFWGSRLVTVCAFTAGTAGATAAIQAFISTVT